jgi:oligopeptide/dipeptide ABC transporter ATP-binding protein
MNSEVLLDVTGLGKTFGDNGIRLGGSRPAVRAVDSIDLKVFRGETLAVVGESGCGKSTLGRLLLHLITPSEGRIVFDGQDLSQLKNEEIRMLRRRMQMVFQDPFGSLSPRRSVAQIIAEPMEVFGMVKSRAQVRERVAELLTQVGLPPQFMDRKPRQFSGGQRQRIGLARAISVDPAFIVADEPVSALDVSVQAQVINLMQDLQKQKGFSYFFVAHDLAVVRHIADRVAVMYLGRIVEIGDAEQIYRAPQHPYTEALLSAAPHPDPDTRPTRIILKGDTPSPTNIPSGCAFRTRCPMAQEVCARDRPPLLEVAAGQSAACHFARPNPLTSTASV